MHRENIVSTNEMCRQSIDDTISSMSKEHLQLCGQLLIKSKNHWGVEKGLDKLLSLLVDEVRATKLQRGI